MNNMDKVFISEDQRLAVKKGIYWMDENYPGWETRIDFDSFAMAKCDSCVIGQACMDLDYFSVLEVGSGSMTGGEAWAIEHGFDVVTSDISEQEWDEYGFNGPTISARYSTLEVLWTEEVRRRLG